MISRVLSFLLVLILSNSWGVKSLIPWWCFVFLGILYSIFNVKPCLFKLKGLNKRLKIEKEGCELLIIFLSTIIITLCYEGYLFFTNISLRSWLISILVAIVIEGIVFWNGITRVYLTSTQLGIRLRTIGLVCGWIPLVNIWALTLIIKTTYKEVEFEREKLELNKRRKSLELCKTKYPILLVHGVFFRDFKLLNYWGRIPKELEENGATIFYGNHQSAAPVRESGEEIKVRIEEIIKETKCEKVNIIAHSKGGLDCRYAIGKLGIEDKVASLTTVNTPHKGCIFAEYLLNKIPKEAQEFVGDKYNRTLKLLGDHNPNFLDAINDLTYHSCESFNKEVNYIGQVYTRSIGSKLNGALSGRFPLNVSYPLVKHFDGVNDGLVSEESFKWSENHIFLTIKGKRGLSHADMIDLNRENIEGFDVREFYVKLVNELKEMGI